MTFRLIVTTVALILIAGSYLREHLSYGLDFDFTQGGKYPNGLWITDGSVTEQPAGTWHSDEPINFQGKRRLLWH